MSRSRHVIGHGETHLVTFGVGPTHSHYEVHRINARSLASRLRSEPTPEIEVKHHDWEHLVAGKDQRPKLERFTAWLHGIFR